MKNSSPSLEIERPSPQHVLVKIGGKWTIEFAEDLEICFKKIKDLKGIPTLNFVWDDFQGADTAGAWIFGEILTALKKKGLTCDLSTIPESFAPLLQCIEEYLPERRVSHFRTRSFRDFIIHVGEATSNIGSFTYKILEFLGQVVIALVKTSTNLRRIKFIPLVSHMERIGVDAIPIVATISFLIGLVFAYQGEEQLHRFGADIYTINLVGLSIVRESGILLAAIVVAGRTGSAITAELGIMKINQEIDAMNVFGLDPLEYLVLPRMLALICMMPFLAFIADLAGLLGGGVWVVYSMDYSVSLYLKQLGTAINQWSFWIGIIKAPVFAFAIGLVSCFEGFQVDGGAESVGFHTTKSVVEAIFLVIVADALFSIFFSQMGV